MLFQILCCHSAIQFFGFENKIAKGFFVYLCIQVIFSYVIAGLVKVKNSEWRNGQALPNIAKLLRYQVPKTFQLYLNNRNISLALSWLVIVFEILFFLPLLFPQSALFFLLFGLLFHFANFYFFGLNRFFWTWLATYPLVLIFYLTF